VSFPQRAPGLGGGPVPILRPRHARRQGHEPGPPRQVAQQPWRTLVFVAFQQDEARIAIRRRQDLHARFEAIAIGGQNHGAVARQVLLADDLEPVAAVRTQPQQSAHKEIRQLAAQEQQHAGDHEAQQQEQNLGDLHLLLQLRRVQRQLRRVARHVAVLQAQAEE